MMGEAARNYSEPALRVVPAPRDINASKLTARNVAQGPVATVLIGEQTHRPRPLPQIWGLSAMRMRMRLS